MVFKKRLSRREALAISSKFSMGTLLGISAFESMSCKANAQAAPSGPSEKLLFVLRGKRDANPRKQLYFLA